MDVNELFSATLNPDPNVRKHAELQLRQAERTPGFMAAVLEAAASSQQNLAVQQAAAVYFKNRVSRSWEDDSSVPNQIALAADEKEMIKQRVVPILVSAPVSVRPQWTTVLNKILAQEFPDKWPGFMETTIQLLRNQGDLQSTYAGLVCLLEITRVYRWKSGDKRVELDRIIRETFPVLLEIGKGLVGQESVEAGEMLRLVLKIYKSTIGLELSKELQAPGSIVPWGSLFLQVVGKPLPEDDNGERDVTAWWKAKKWAYYSLNRLFERYGNPSTLSGVAVEQYDDFAKGFVEQFAPEILKAYLQQVELWIQRKIWLSKRCLQYTIHYLEACIKPKSTWVLLKPHVENLVSHFIFPQICLTDEDLESWEDDPAEYIHRKLDFFEDFSSTDFAAIEFLVALAQKRKKHTFMGILGFVNSTLTAQEAAGGAANPREKEGALRMVGALAHIILAKNSPVSGMMEGFFVSHVFPEFQSPHGFLRARACEMMNRFADLQFQDKNNLGVAYTSIINCMGDKEIPVRVEAALALQPMIQHPEIKNAMVSRIPQIMEQLLNLSNEIDVDALANVMEQFVEVFSEELTPFAVQLTESLRNTFLRIMQESVDQQKKFNPNDDFDASEYVDDKSLAALGVLNTIGTLILSLENTPEVLLQLENILLPVIQLILGNEVVDLYGEIFEIIDSCTFSSKMISPTMWQIFELLHKCFKDSGMDFIDEMLPCLDNFVSYGADSLRQNPTYLAAIIDIIQTVFSSDRLGAQDRICGCKLAEAVLLNLRGAADQYLQFFADQAMVRLTTPGEVKTADYRIYLLELVINCIYYNPAATLAVLEQRGYVQSFFNLWFTNIGSFSRVHDKKLSICAITALFSIPQEQVPASIQAGWPQLMQGLLTLFEGLPQAMKNREEMEKEIGNEDDFGDFGDTWGEDEWDEAAEEDEDVKDKDNEYLDFLSREADKLHGGTVALGDEEEEFVVDDLEEEPLFETPLDKIDAYILFRDLFSTLQQSQPQVYSGLTGRLSDREQALFQSIVNQAQVNASK
ncbi:Nonsense-mediated mRNA decay protein 5 [Saitoella coloradoensis]